MSDSTTTQSNIDPTSDTPQKAIAQTGGVLMGLALNNEEMFQRLKRVNEVRREATAILEETPLLIEYLEVIYPPYDFENRLTEFEERLEAIDNV